MLTHLTQHYNVNHINQSNWSSGFRFVTCNFGQYQEQKKYFLVSTVYFHYYLVMWKLYCLAGDLDTDIVEADSNVGRVDESSIGSGDTVGWGLVDSGHGGDGVGGDLGDDSPDRGGD